MSTSTASQTKPGGAVVAPKRPSDRIFGFFSTGSAVLIMVILAGVALFLIIQALPAITAQWGPGSAFDKAFTQGFSGFWPYVGPLVFGTIYISIIALLMATPVAVGIALFISHYSPRKISAILGYIVDLLAAVPSVVFGLWGIFVIRDFLKPVQQWLNQYLGWIFPFGGEAGATGSSLFTAAVVLAVMIMPIITAISREIFLQTPRLHEEAALALGATRWEMIQLAVFPYARSGLVSAILLGLGRAMGETMAVAMIMSGSVEISFLILTDGHNSQGVAPNIANQFPIADEMARSALVGTGLVLFVISFAVNFLARAIINRKPKAKKAKPETPELLAATEEANQ